MFEKSLSDKLKRIFDLDKVSFDAPSETQEQECLFVNVKSAKNQVGSKRFKSKVTGTLSVYGNPEKLPFGYFSKHIAEADLEDTKDFMFYNIEQNNQMRTGIAERTMDFIYLFDEQYNPNIGELTSLETVATVGNEQ